VKIYTKTGDEGQTSLFAGGRVDKDHLRLHAYGTIDELNSVLGMARSQPIDATLSEMLATVQMALFHVGADLATPLDADAQWVVRVDEAMITRLEQEIDTLDAELPELKNFIVPGGTGAAATLHFARTVCRRAERWITALAKETALNPLVQRYVNRLSDWLFVMARAANARAGVDDIPWQSPRQDKP
jgi:cob(I)alamin adenosyltransferase